MKYRATTLAALTLTLLMGSAGAQNQPEAINNTLVNGDFEEAMEMSPTEGQGKKTVSAAGWTTLLGDLPTVVTWGNDPKEMPKKGGRFLRITDTSDKEPVAIESTRVPAQPNEIYAASIWVRTQDKGDPALYLNFYDADGKRLTFKTGQAPTGGPYPDWVNLTARVRAPKRAALVSIALYSYPKDKGNYDFDDGIMGPVAKQGEGGNASLPAAPPPLPKPEVDPATRELNQPSIMNFQGKSIDPSAGVAAPNAPKEQAPITVPTAEGQQATATPAAPPSAPSATPNGSSGAAAPAKTPTKPTANAPGSVGISEEERRALGIEPLPAGEGASGPMKAKPVPNQELPPPWILPKEAEGKKE
jgi:hypothetical protein